MESTALKLKLRKHLCEKRRILSNAIQAEKAESLKRIFIKQAEFIESQHIAFYWPQEGEMDPLPLMEVSLQTGKHCYLPVLNAQQKALEFVEYHREDLLFPNHYGILEPRSEPGINTVIAPWKLDLVLTPLVAFDKLGHRLGRGAGYYDRTFHFLLEEEPLKKSPLGNENASFTQKPILIGLGYEFQQYDLLPNESWDVPVNGIATEKLFYRVS